MWCNGTACKPDALEAAKRVIGLTFKLFGPEHPEHATSLIELGRVRWARGEYEEAQPLFGRALEIRERHLGMDDPAVAEVLYDLAEVLRLLFQREESKRLHERSLAIVEHHFDRNHRAVGKSLNGLANIVADMEDPERQTVSMYRLSVAVRECALGPDHPDLAISLHNLAFQLFWDGEYFEARPICERAVRIQELALRPNHPMLARSMMYLALIDTELGFIDEACRLYDRVIDINGSSLSFAHPRSAEALVLYGSLLTHTGQYARARLMFERSIESYEALFGATDPRLACPLGYVADLAADMGDYLAAGRLFERAVEIFESGPSAHPDCSDLYERKADFLARVGRSEEAMALYQQQLEEWEETEGSEAPEYGRVLGKLARLRHQNGDLSAASVLYQRALAIRVLSSGRLHPEVADVNFGLAGVSADSGDYEEAVDRCEAGLHVLETAFGSDHPLVARGLNDLAVYRFLGADTSVSLRTAIQAEATSRRHMTGVAKHLAEREALRYAAVKPPALDLALSIVAQGAAADDIEEVWDAVIRSRAVVLDEMATRQRAAFAADDPQVAKSYRALVSARQRLAHLIVAGPNERNPEAWKTLVDDARRENERLERLLSERSLAFRKELELPRAGLGDVLGALPSGASLVAYVQYRDLAHRGPTDFTGRTEPGVPSYMAFAADSTGSVVAVPLGLAAEVDDLVDDLRRMMQDALKNHGRGTRRAEASFRAAAGVLRARIWDPVTPHVLGSDVVLVVPDGQLNLVNFNAFPVGESDYLIESGFRIHYLSAERGVVAGGRPVSVERVLALGAPAFDDDRLFASLAGMSGPESLSDTVRLASKQVYRGQTSSCGAFRSIRFAPLPAAENEIDDIVELWRTAVLPRSNVGQVRPTNADGPRVLRLTGRAASESALTALAPGNNVLHLATHGFFVGGECSIVGRISDPGGGFLEEKENPLLLSGLALAGANHRDAAGPDEQDGILTAQEIASLDLSSVEWAVLSACDTGVGEVRAGEGVFGLRRAFQIAGARTLIMSLWPVEDEVTRAWMRALYTNRLVNEMSTIDSVHEASLALLTDRRKKDLSTHPCYWAGFIASGDWR
jgi:tetratricopeptide (TPR) repeat protein